MSSFAAKEDPQNKGLVRSLAAQEKTQQTAPKTSVHSKPQATKCRYFSNRECEYFPCHKGADPHNFNCLFCYCPLYLLGRNCGGNFRYLANGTKVCTDCLFPHLRENYQAVIARYPEIRATLAKIDALSEESLAVDTKQ